MQLGGRGREARGPGQSIEILRFAAFTSDPAGGNPAGVVLDASGLDESRMLAVAAEVGYSETAFVIARDDEGRRFRLRYFSPLTEVAFCGHVTVATAVALAERIGPGELAFDTPAGEIRVATAVDDTGTGWATLTVRQGEDMGRPSDLLAEADPVDARVRVTGQAVPIGR